MDKKERQKEFKRRLYRFVLDVIRFVNHLPENRVTKIIGNQLIRSATSILANYIEAYAASSKKDYTNFFHYSLKSANESKVWIALLRDSENAEKDQANQLLKEADEIALIFGSSILTLKGKRSI